MKAYLAYVRVSTVRQENGSSLQEQKSAITAYAARHGLTISSWYEEVQTAAKQGRTAFNQLLAELTKGRAAGVIIHKIDRSARNLKDWARLGELIDLGIEVHFAHESLDLASRGGRLAADIQAVVAADYVRNLKQEVRKGFYGRLKQGLYPLKAPRGYLDHGKGKPKTVDPVAGPLMRQAFELYATGGYSLPTLQIEMERRGLRGKKNRPIAVNALAKMFHNPFYIGIIRIAKTRETFQGCHEPLISAAIFERVQKTLRNHTYARPQKHDPFFRRVLKCDGCDYSLVGEHRKGRTYYRCHSMSCRGTSMREDYIIEDLNAFFLALRFSSEEMGDLRDYMTSETVKDRTDATIRRQEQKRLLGLCEGRLSRLTDALLDGDLDKELFQQRKASLLLEKRALLDAIHSNDDLPSSSNTIKKLELGNTAQINAETDFAEEIRELLKVATSNLSVWGKNLVITPQFPFAEVLKWRGFSYSALSGGVPRNGDTLCPLRIQNGRTVWLDLRHVPDIPQDLSAAELYRTLDARKREVDAAGNGGGAQASSWRSAA